MERLGLIWRAGGLLFSTDVVLLHEVLAPVACTPAPSVPEWVRGLFVYRGQLIPLVDVAALLGRATTGGDLMSNRVLVVRSNPLDGSQNESTIGLWVEGVVELARIDFDAPGGHPGFAGEVSRLLGPLAQTEFGLVQQVRPAELFTPEQAKIIWARLKVDAA